MKSDQVGDVLVGKSLMGIVAALVQNSGINSQYAFEKMKQKQFFDASNRTFSKAQLSVFDATECLRSGIQEGADAVQSLLSIGGQVIEKEVEKEKQQFSL